MTYQQINGPSPRDEASMARGDLLHRHSGHGPPAALTQACGICICQAQARGICVSQTQARGICVCQTQARGICMSECSHSCVHLLHINWGSLGKNVGTRKRCRPVAFGISRVSAESWLFTGYGQWWLKMGNSPRLLQAEAKLPSHHPSFLSSCLPPQACGLYYWRCPHSS